MLTEVAPDDLGVAFGCDGVGPVVAQFQHRQRLGLVDAGRNRSPHIAPFRSVATP